jgi:hypothetical protein
LRERFGSNVEADRQRPLEQLLNPGFRSRSSADGALGQDFLDEWSPQQQGNDKEVNLES